MDGREHGCKRRGDRGPSATYEWTLPRRVVRVLSRCLTSPVSSALESRAPSARQVEFVPPMALLSYRQAAKTIKNSWTSRQSIAAAALAGAILLGVTGFLQTGLSTAAGSTPSGEPAASAEPNRPGAGKGDAAGVTASYELGLLPFLKQYCVDCHGDGAHKGDFSFDRYRDLDALKRDRHVWTRRLKLLKIEAMPPADADTPPPEERTQAVKWLDHQLFYVDCSQPQDPGRVTVRRLNKTEYNNTDPGFVGVDFHPADDFPADDTGHGFDNIADVLTVPPLLLEKYLGAAEEHRRPGGSHEFPVVRPDAIHGKTQRERPGLDPGESPDPRRRHGLSNVRLPAPGAIM